MPSSGRGKTQELKCEGLSGQDSVISSVLGRSDCGTEYLGVIGGWCLLADVSCQAWGRNFALKNSKLACRSPDSIETQFEPKWKLGRGKTCRIAETGSLISSSLH